MSHLSMGVSASATAPLATAPRPTFTLSVSEDPRPGIPQPPRDPKAAVVSPSEFLAAHPDIAGWSGVEHDVYRHLVEVSRVRLTPQHLYAEARIAQTAARNLIDSLWDLPKAERPAVKAEARALYVKASKLAAEAEDAEAAVSRDLSAADLALTTNIAYLHRDRQIAERAKFEQAQYELIGVAA